MALGEPRFRLDREISPIDGRRYGCCDKRVVRPRVRIGTEIGQNGASLDLEKMMSEYRRGLLPHHRIWSGDEAVAEREAVVGRWGLISAMMRPDNADKTQI